MFEYVGDVCSFSACVINRGLFVGRFWWNVYLVLYMIQRFLWADWERAIVKDIVYSALFLAIFFIM
jgi:hypothetical protein